MSIAERFTIFIDEKAVSGWPDASVIEVMWARDRAAAGLVEKGAAYVTDGVGRRIDPDTRVRPGDIFRVVRSAGGNSPEPRA